MAIIEECWRQVLILPDGDPAFVRGPEFPGEDSDVYYNRNAKVSKIDLEFDSTKTVIRIANTCVLSVCAAHPERTEALVQSAIGTPFEHSSPTPRYPVLMISKPPLPAVRTISTTCEEETIRNLIRDAAKPDMWWAAVYVLWELLHAQEFIPVVLGSDLDPHGAAALETFLLYSGLARRATAPTKRPPPASPSPLTSTSASSFPNGKRNYNPAPTDPSLLFLERAAFWQGAGTGPAWSNTRGWLRPVSIPLPISSGLPVNLFNDCIQHMPFPHTQSFTRSDAVIAQHPLRPPVPPPGNVLYARYCAQARRVLRLHVLDPESRLNRERADEGARQDENEGKSGAERTTEDAGKGGACEPDTDAEAFHRWMNDPRVNAAWGEAGTKEQHRAYMRRIARDVHVVPLIMSWDGERMGYTEVVWIKEDHVAPYVPSGARDYDRGIHILVGEEKFRGNSSTWYRSLNHFVYLSDPRTTRIVMEPRENNEAVKRMCLKSGVHFESYFYFPYKYSVLTMSLRERFFKMDMLQ